MVEFRSQVHSSSSASALLCAQEHCHVEQVHVEGNLNAKANKEYSIKNIILDKRSLEKEHILYRSNGQVSTNLVFLRLMSVMFVLRSFNL